MNRVHTFQIWRMLLFRKILYCLVDITTEKRFIRNVAKQLLKLQPLKLQRFSKRKCYAMQAYNYCRKIQFLCNYEALAD